MKMYYQNKQRMYETTLAYLQANPEKVALIVALNLSVKAFETIVGEIGKEMLVQEAQYKGITKDKADTRLALEVSTTSIANATMAYANTVNDNELYSLVATNMSQLEKKTESNFVNFCKTINSVATTNLALLEPWGLKEEALTDNTALIAKFEGLKTQKRQKQTMQSTALNNVTALFKQGDKVLKRTIDNAVFSLEGTEGTFVKNYKQNRLILNLGHTYTTFKGITKVKGSEVLLSNTQIDFIKKDGGEILSVVTDEKGKYRERLNPDTYDIVVKHEHYEQFVIEGVKIMPGELKVENFELVPKV